jgi:putative transposase
MGFSAETLELIRQIDRVLTQYPFFGSRQIAAYLPRKGYHTGCHRIRRLMKVMGFEVIYKRPNTSKKHPENWIYPYLLRNMQITRANQVWCADISYILVKRGFLIFGSDYGLGNAQGSILAIIEHDGCELLQGSTG